MPESRRSRPTRAASPVKESGGLELPVRRRRVRRDHGPTRRALPKLGDRLEFFVTHCDPTVNLYDRIYAVRGDAVEAVWPVIARAVDHEANPRGKCSLVVREYDEAIGFYRRDRSASPWSKTRTSRSRTSVGSWWPRRARASRACCWRGPSARSKSSRIGNQTGGRVFLFLYTDDFWRDFHAYTARGVVFIREPRRRLSASRPCSRISTATCGTWCSPGLLRPPAWRGIGPVITSLGLGSPWHSACSGTGRCRGADGGNPSKCTELGRNVDPGLGVFNACGSGALIWRWLTGREASWSNRVNLLSTTWAGRRAARSSTTRTSSWLGNGIDSGPRRLPTRSLRGPEPAPRSERSGDESDSRGYSRGFSSPSEMHPPRGGNLFIPRGSFAVNDPPIRNPNQRLRRPVAT